MKNKFHYFLNLVFLFSIITFLNTSCSCKRTVEGETKNWENNKSLISSTKVNFPKFANAIDEVYANANSAWNSANNINDEEQKINALAQANQIISSSFVSKLSTINSSVNDLNSQLSKYSAKSYGDAEIANRINFLMSDVRNTQSYVDNTLLSGANTAAEATALINNVFNRINQTKESINLVAKMIGEKQRVENEKKKVEQDRLNKIKEDSLASAKALEDWKCGYCGNSNKHDVNKCNSCGAGRNGENADTKNTWKCEYCDSHNDNSLSKCAACGASK